MASIEEVGSVKEAKSVVTRWLEKYNNYRPHGSLKGLIFFRSLDNGGPRTKAAALVVAASAGTDSSVSVTGPRFLLPPSHFRPKVTDVFGFSTLQRTTPELPALIRYTARDGERLAYRFYDSTAETILIFIHGSSYHGAAYHQLALTLSKAGAVKVYLPNLRGHYMSGKRRGDINYMGQLEDDIADIISMARHQQQDGDIYIGGHSSGGGLAIRFAGGTYGQLASGYILLSPILPMSRAIKGGNAGGWASLNQTRMYGLLALNAVGIQGFNGLAIIEFNKPEKYWDGTETLSYSYRLNSSFHPRYNYQADIKALNDNVLVLVGADDESNDVKELKTLFTGILPRSRFVILPNVNHFGVFSDPTSHSIISGFVRNDVEKEGHVTASNVLSTGKKMSQR